MSDVINNSYITIPALGRPFSLGSLYDCRNESLFTGQSLWGPSILEKYETQRNDSASFEVQASESLSEKCALLNVGASMMLSILSGQVDVSNSAKYTTVWHSKRTGYRIMVKYHMLSHTDKLTMRQLNKENIEFPELITQGRATHVVTGIQYGGDAFFVFERETSDSDQKKEIECHMKAVIQTYIGAEANFKMSKEDKKFVKSIRCKFYGDCLLPNIPTTFEEAIRVCHLIPKLLKEGGGKPQVISLLPLVVFNPNACQVKYEVGEDLGKVITGRLERLFKIKNESASLESLAKEHGLFQSMCDEQLSFQHQIGIYIASMKKKWKEILPIVRSGANLNLLLSVFNEREEDSFSIHRLEKWLDARAIEIKKINMYLESLPQIKVCKTEGDFCMFINNPAFDTVYCLTIKRPNAKEYLGKLKKDNITRFQSEDVSACRTMAISEEKTDVAVIKKFGLFIKGKNRKNGFCVFEKVTDTETITASVQKYKNGQCVDQDYDMGTRNDEQCSLL